MAAAVLDDRERMTQQGSTVELRGFSHEARSRILPALDRAMASCGCWVLERNSTSAAQVGLLLEVPFSAVFELYSSLIGAGLELTRASHAAMTSLCMLRRHQQEADASWNVFGRVVTVALEVSFFDESELEAGVWSMGLA